jgi:NADPH-dependent 2,4-dienoyl-CoA reductase/sulfur reductase-like enzyme
MSSKQDRAIVPMQQSSGKPYLDKADIVIIGNGIAGLTAAVEARRLAPEKRIVIITDQNHPTINTPALKQFAVGKLAREQLLAYPPGTERAERIHVITSRVEEIHAQSKYVTLSGNRGFGYDSLLIATGSKPMGLPENVPGRNFDGVMVLHRLQDFLDFRRRIPEVSEAVVVGGGVLANETVMGLLHWGIRVHWLIRGKKFMRGMLDEAASEMILANVRRAGAIVHTETEVTGVVARVGSVAGVITNRQEMIPCQLVLSCTGTKPVMTLAQRCSVPMRHKNGILVDDKLRTSVRDIYAAGDVAAIRDPLTGSFETRALWYYAVLQGRMAGRMMADHKDEVSTLGVNWHATHLGELYMLGAGDPLSEDGNVEILTDTSGGSYRRMAIVDDRLIGYLSLGSAQPDSLSIARIIDEGHSIRSIIKPLLKGNFDAREYLSQIRSRAAQGFLTGRLPDLSPVGGGVRTQQLPPTTDPLGPTPFAPPLETPAPARREFAPVEERRTELLQPAASVNNQSSAIFFEEEVSPFTGNLPQVGRIAEGISPASSLSGPLTEEMISPFSGNLPAIAKPDPLTREVNQESKLYSGSLSSMPGRVVEPTPVAVPRNGNSRKLWAYASQDNPAIRTR